MQKLATRILLAVIFSVIMVGILKAYQLANHTQISNNDTLLNSTNYQDLSNLYFSNLMNNQKTFPIISEGYGLLIYNENEELLLENSQEYIGEQLNYFMTAVNSNPQYNDGAVLIFAGNKLVPFKVDGQETNYDIYRFTLDPYSYINIPISINPLLEGENIYHPLYFIFISNMNPLSEDTKPYTLTSSFYNLVSKERKSSSDFNVVSVPIRNELVGELLYGIESGFFIDEESGVGYYRDLKMKSVWDDKLFFEAYGRPGDYSSIIVFNDEILRIGDDNYIYWNIGENEMIQYEIDIAENLKSEENTLFSITFPLNYDEYPIFPYSSPLFYLEIDEGTVGGIND